MADIDFAWPFREMRRASLITGSLIVVAVLAVASVSFGVPGYVIGRGSVSQPLEFNHQVHVRKHQITCVQCHEGAESLARATIPNIEVCGQICHRPDLPALTKTRAEAQLRKYLETGQRIPWQKVYRVEPHVYFSHARHTVLGQLSCETCHGNVGDRTEPVQEQAKLITMDGCMACHEQHRVSNDCNDCHR
jgi:hypothetical protein